MSAQNCSPTEVNGKGFKVVCAYVYPWLESAKTYRTKEQARAELRKWQLEAAEKGQEIIGRVFYVHSQPYIT